MASAQISLRKTELADKKLASFRRPDALYIKSGAEEGISTGVPMKKEKRARSSADVCYH